ncbi:aminotransferase class V-fold PLP-dependent enzyme [Paenibacillus kribbensis]|uniref:pyridoxal-phosphate-dependent aminotransferase family protein n=1 Tax=Paenibacillus TaxID=44249 RepID=UPI00024F0512|nr:MULTISPECIES: aminotransferase class V-fold PLP-dependent enzyme [Paenibacillus]EHS57581.1 serine-pyruvate aminotransferase [Paenibacillus sp. Aloe-11]MEC0236267.1 aminotransferase class V-fold PLP-dependent enzyme [Paenibacillus kribbensis]
MSREHKGFVPLSLSEFNTLTSLLSKLLFTQYPPVIIPGEAILGIEAMAAGISSPGRTILNVVTGPYGSLFGKWLERGGATVVEVKVPFDEVVTVEEVAAAIERYKPCALSFVQAEVVTGGSNPAREILNIAHDFNLITVMDSVSAVGGEALLVDEWGVDLVAVGAQKALAGPNGVSAVNISPRGWEFLESNENAPRNSILSLLDMKPSQNGSASVRVPANIPTLEARALISALTRIEEEGLAQVIKRHELAASSTIAGIKALGVEPWQKDSKYYSTLTTTVRISQEQNLRIDQPIGIVAPGDGELFGNLLRINHFGANACQQSVEEAIAALAQLLNQDPDHAIEAIRLIWGNEHDQ